MMPFNCTSGGRNAAMRTASIRERDCPRMMDMRRKKEQRVREVRDRR